MWQPMVGLLAVLFLATAPLGAEQLTPAPLGRSASPAVVATGPVVLQGTVSGRVVDSMTQRPLPAARVLIAGTSLGALTNAEGYFEIPNVPEGEVTVEVSLIGYATVSQTITVVSGQTVTVNFALLVDALAVDEIVVVGYGTVQRRDLTGSVASVGTNQIREMSVSRVDQALVGKVSGVEVIAHTGEPGAGPRIRIRGVGSISASSQPLYVVDGHPTSSIQMLNPADIESIDILKDASATAIYGSRGANGVIIITTKRGSEGNRPDIRLDVRNSWQKVAKTPEFLTAAEQVEYYIYSIRSRNVDAGYDVSGPPDTWEIKPPQTILDYYSGRVPLVDEEMLDHVLRVAPVREVNLSVAGTAGDLRYALSGGFLDEDGIIIESGFKRYTLRANVDGQLTDRLSIGTRINLALSDRDIVDNGQSGGGQNTSIMAQAASWHRYYPAYNPDGSYFAMQGVDASTVLFNPIALAREYTNKAQSTNIFANITVDYRLTPAFRFRQMFGATGNINKSWSFRPGEMEVFAFQQAQGSDGVSIGTNWISESTLNYARSFGDHSFTGLAGFTAQRDLVRSNSVSSTNYPNNLIETLNAAIINGGSSSVSEWALVSYLGRVSYDYRSKYYVTGSMRVDGSSRFGDNNKYAVFPSAALAWRISEESFMQDIPHLNDLKLRVSYGRTGNDAISLYQTYATIASQNYILGGQRVQGYAPQRNANPNLTWEKQAQYNFGIDLEAFDRRVQLTLDHFRSWSESLLLDVAVPRVTGFSSSLENIGKVANTGWELTLNTINLQRDRMQWSTSINLSTYKNEVLALGPEGAPILSNGERQITMIGKPMGMHYGLKVQGIFLNEQQLAEGPIYNPGAADQSQPGDIRFVDLDGDGVVTLAGDRTIIGNPYPDFYFGATSNFTWGNFSATVSLQGTYGNTILNQNLVIFRLTRSRSKTLATERNFWRSPEEPGDGKTPRPNDATTGGIRLHSERYLEDGSYLRVNNVTLSYTLPEQWARRFGTQSLRVYLNSSNLLTITNYTGWNPAAASSGSSLTPGVDQYAYPLPKSVTFGIEMGL